MALTVAAVRAAQPGDVLRDAAVPGLQLRVFAERRSFYLYYRTRNGVQRKPKVGDFPTITIDQARKIARQWLSVAHQGGDPSRERSDALKAPTVAELGELYMSRHGDAKKTGHEDKAKLKKYIGPRLGRHKVADVTPSDIEDFMDWMRKRGTLTLGNRCLSLLSKMFNLAIKWGYRTDNPAKGATRFKEKKRRRYMTADEYRALATALVKMEGEAPGGVAVIRLLMLTGARLGEIVGARREWVRGSTLYLPDSKTGEKEIHLPPVAMEIIENAHDLGGYLVGVKTRPTKVWAKLLKLSGIKNLRIHDLRHSYASEALASGLSLAQIGELLGHKSTQTTHRYAHLVDEMRRKASADVANRIAKRVA